ncbi:hypothetical protein ACFXKG_30895 [Streptomyces sp. NPDC059255]|uniref:hypothetical protein n=1 Tax=Streptomyces sp. NPDC059255 TaxID=3346793 RepID=UPI0036AEC964
MTKQAHESAGKQQDDGPARDGAKVVAVRETTGMRDRLIERTCDWCGAPVPYTGKGRPPRYCSPAHRNRAYELRRAEKRADRPVSEGGRSPEPVREVVERTETVVRTVVREGPVEIRQVPARRLSGQPYTLPEDVLEWAQMLRHLRRAVDDGKIPTAFREKLAQACELTARALRGQDLRPGQ